MVEFFIGKFGGKLCVGVGVWPLIFFKDGECFEQCFISNEHGIRRVFKENFFFAWSGEGCVSGCVL